MDDKPQPRLMLTVPEATWQAMASMVRPTFADSYLSGAIQNGATLTPRGKVAYDRLRENPYAVECLRSLNLTLGKPIPR